MTKRSVYLSPLTAPRKWEDAINTLVTIGSGDLTPTTSFGKIVTVLFAISRGEFLGFLNTAMERRVERREEPLDAIRRFQT